ncbi:MAG: ABC transporter substrate-binding protein [Aminobacterium sp.]|jgi:glycine betaine/proline transport system substrate-binding protein|uniref:ABC transporter substrate-binding protein n=1 Tax=unclassified Aminobacterium TaxID=2685012 RepID=UPI001BD02FFC|nr:MULTISPECIES: ABC transporter substrate-binding protein [unclassified Aminobacterium]MDD2206311.1 ABC transporter substrate-binding protein [Aminobacterium sp.]MDD3426114.1 ABC transporter substrate-binding protein [Aminobacterium sp.]MDD3707316.1 ABC transporter substrate-binding protein [Aminobacterium sp.]MDD4228328.1 ABC transporter substrate-binding protein [Aminobacterium sp.]MDD4551799.1 ABC transporter substrate-binding protein [Aminobacterium sp.]
MKTHLLKRTIVAAVCMVSVMFLGSIGAEAARPVTFIDFSWDSVQVHNRIVGYILTYGYEKKVDYMFAESLPGLMGIERGDADITMELWADNFPEWWQEAQEKGKAKSLGLNYPDAPQGWYVPRYIVEGDKEKGIKPLAPDLKSVFDLPKYWELFKDPEKPSKGRLYNGPAGWNINSINSEKVKAYGLDEKFTAFDPGSQTALAAAIASAYERGEPVLAYYWEPTAIMGMYDMVKLEEPPYSNDLWGTTYRCACPSVEVLVLVNTKFAEANPEITKFLERYETTLDQNNKALAYMKTHNVDAHQAAIWFLKTYSDNWKNWVQDENVIANVEKALQEEAIK